MPDKLFLSNISKHLTRIQVVLESQREVRDEEGLRGQIPEILPAKRDPVASPQFHLSPGQGGKDAPKGSGHLART